MDAIQVDDAVVGQQPTLAPDLILLGQRVVEAADGAGTGGHSCEGSSDLSNFVGTDPTDKHLGQGVGHLRFVAIVTLEHLAVKLAFPISGDCEILHASSGSHQIARIGPIAIASATGGAFAPRGTNALL